MTTQIEIMTRAEAETRIDILGFLPMSEFGQQDNYLASDGRQARITYDYDKADKDNSGGLVDGYYVIEISTIRLSRSAVAATPVQ